MRRRLTPSHLFIGVVAVLAFVFNYLALQERDASVSVVLAVEPIPAGAAFSADMGRLAPIDSGFEGIDHFVTKSALPGYEGWTVARPLAAGEPVGRSDLVEPVGGEGRRIMSLPVAVEHAAGGTLVPGDRVDVIAVGDDGPSFVATALEVVAVAEVESGGLAGVTPYHIVVAVDAEQALALAAAIAEGGYEVLRSTGVDPGGDG